MDGAFIHVRLFFGGIRMKLTSYVQERQLTVALTGEIDHHTAREMMQAISEKIDLYLPLRCILDFRDVRFMDSSGIAVVLHTLRRMKLLQGRVILQNIPAQPYKVLRAAGIEKITEVREECPQ
jgi:stage II sporulation protein AA (anti-sigma F factor antagonist)